MFGASRVHTSTTGWWPVQLVSVVSMADLPGSPCLDNGSRTLLVSASGFPQLGVVQRASSPFQFPLSRRGQLVNQ